VRVDPQTRGGDVEEHRLLGLAIVVAQDEEDFGIPLPEPMLDPLESRCQKVVDEVAVSRIRGHQSHHSGWQQIPTKEDRLRHFRLHGTPELLVLVRLSVEVGYEKTRRHGGSASTVRSDISAEGFVPIVLRRKPQLYYSRVRAARLATSVHEAEDLVPEVDFDLREPFQKGVAEQAGVLTQADGAEDR
jgi:hypothetical protein